MPKKEEREKKTSSAVMPKAEVAKVAESSPPLDLSTGGGVAWPVSSAVIALALSLIIAFLSKEK